MRSEVMSVSSVRLFRLALGTLLLLVGTALLVARGLAWLDLEPRMLRALEGGALCALGTALGAVPVLVIRNMPVALADTLLGFGAGVMLAATAFSLIIPGLDAAQAGMKEMSDKFNAMGQQVYVEADKVKEGNKAL